MIIDGFASHKERAGIQDFLEPRIFTGLHALFHAVSFELSADEQTRQVYAKVGTLLTSVIEQHPQWEPDKTCHFYDDRTFIDTGWLLGNLDRFQAQMPDSDPVHQFIDHLKSNLPDLRCEAIHKCENADQITINIKGEFEKSARADKLRASARAAAAPVPSLVS